jgi:ABC-type multidrug transport system fused ATPase/permease subunit
VLRLADPTAGRLTVGGIDLRSVDTESWRQRLAWVPQRPTIFRGTIADNIRLGDPHASELAARIAADRAGADAFVQRLPRGYDTVVGDGGRVLSAGERRRIALARAFLRDAELVVLDEPTADLDAANAELVREAVTRLCLERTVLLIAHRPELVESADRVLLLDHGQAVPVTERAAA